MKYHALPIIAVGILFCICLSVQATSERSMHEAASDLRNFAFARCMTLSFDDIKVVRADADAASNAYALSVRLNEFDVVNMDGFVKQWLKKTYLGKFTADLKLMRCIDFQQSADRATVPTEYPAHSYDASVQLRNFALAYCVGRVFGSEIMRNEAGGATSGYIELGENDISDYSYLGVLVRQWLERSNSHSLDKPSPIMQCMDIYHGAALRELVDFYTDEALKPLRDFALAYCLSIDNDFDQATRDAAKTEADAAMAHGSMDTDVYQQLSNFAEQWLKRPHKKEDEGCEALYSSPLLFKTIKPYGGLTQKVPDKKSVNTDSLF